MGSLKVQSLVNIVSEEEQFTRVSQLGLRLDSMSVLVVGVRKIKRGDGRRRRGGETDGGRERKEGAGEEE